MDIQLLWETFWEKSQNSYIQASVILIIAFIWAKIFEYILNKFIKKWVKKTKTKLDDKLIKIIHAPIFYSILIFGVLAALFLLGENKNIQIIGKNILVSFVIGLWMMFAIRLSKIFLKAFSRSNGVRIVRPKTLPLFENVAILLAVIIALYFLFSLWGVNMTAWLASAGVLGIAIGFAAKDTLANLFAGVLILADSPYNIGDYIYIDKGNRGKVIHIGLRSTRLLTRDDVEIIIPNAIMGNSKIYNQSGGPGKMFRVRVKVGVSYDSDLDQVENILLDIANTEDLLQEEPSPRVRIRSFAPSDVRFELMGWVENPELRGRTIHSLSKKIFKKFKENNIEIPNEKRDIYIKEGKI